MLFWLITGNKILARNLIHYVLYSFDVVAIVVIAAAAVTTTITALAVYAVRLAIDVVGWCSTFAYNNQQLRVWIDGIVFNDLLF